MQYLTGLKEFTVSTSTLETNYEKLVPHVWIFSQYGLPLKNIGIFNRFGGE
jgi:hypothetical protein